MRFSNNTFNSTTYLPQRGIFSRFGQDALLFAALVAWVGWVCALLSYSRADHAWSSSGTAATAARPANWLGQAGAYLADVSYFLLGFSVWVLVAVLAVFWWRFFRNWMRGGGLPAPDASLLMVRLWTRRLLWMLGLAGLLVASTVLEWSRLYSLEHLLPNHSGGAVGYWMGPLMMRWLGDTGSTVAALAVALALVSWILGFSWGRVAERIGIWVARVADPSQPWSLNARAWWAGKVANGPWNTPEAPARTQKKNGFSIPSEPELMAETDAPASQPQPAKKKSSFTIRIERRLPEGEGTRAGRTDTARPETRDSDSASGKGRTGAAVPAETVAAPVARTHANEPELGAPWEDTSTGTGFKPSLVSPPAKAGTSRSKPAAAAHGSESVVTAGGKGLLPATELLDSVAVRQETVTPETLEMTSRLIEKKLMDFGVEVHVVEALPGPVVTRYEIEPAVGVKGAQIVNLSKDLARSLSLMSIRVVETIPGKNCMALELPNTRRQTIQLKEILASSVYLNSGSLLTVGLGKDIVGQPVVADLAKMPHCLVAGTTGSGKSVGINAMILSILYKAEPKDVRLLMIDPKMLEMAIYEGIPHLLCPVVTDMKQAAQGLNWCVAEMERRYKLMSKLGVRNLAGYNAKIKAAQNAGKTVGNPFSLTPEDPEPLGELPHIVIVIDELADLMMVVGKKIEELIARLAQKARAAGIHLILATQRPSVDVITGLIKANVPTRIAFQVSSKIDSRTILDQMGAETLLGMGDMLYMKGGTGQPVRVHGAFVSDNEVHRVVEYLKSQGEPDYVDGVLEGVSAESESDWAVDFDGAAGGEGGEKDPMYDQAVEVVLKDRKASISYVQRKLRIGYNRAARLLEDMEKAGLVSPLTSSGQRDILVPSRGD